MTTGIKKLLSLSKEANELIKKIKTIQQKKNKTDTDKKKLKNLKSDLKKEKSVISKTKDMERDKFLKVMKYPPKNKQTKSDKGEIMFADRVRRIKAEIDDNYFKELNEAIRTGRPMEFPKRLTKKEKEAVNEKFIKDFEAYLRKSAGGLVAKKYANPIRITNNLKK
tara:strand:+ start:71 stop:568 length:498 start_codon:yes stop_codon:yes gene_type:complete